MIVRAALVAALLVAGACDKGSCKKRVATLQDRLSKVVAWDTGGAAVEVELVEVPGATPRRDGPALVVGVTHDGLSINHRPVPSSIDDLGLGQMIALEREAYRLNSRDAPLVVELWVDRRAPIANLRRVVENFELSQELRVIVKLPGELGIPEPPERVAKTVDAISDGDPSQRATAAAATIEEALGECPAAEKVFGEMAALEPAAKTQVLAKKLAPAIATCGCKTVDVPLLEEILLQILGAREPRRGWVPLDRGKMLEAANVAGLF